MTLYLVSNNMVLEDLVYETDETVEEKRINRPLSIEGEKKAVKLVKKINANIIYSSNYASALATAKYYARYKNIFININSFLNDSKIGKLGNRNIKMLRFMQERDFDFKFNNGESLNETCNRMNIAINSIIKRIGNQNIVIFTHKRAILGYLLKYLDKGYNLDDRLILTYNDKVIIDDVEKDIDIIKLEILHNKIVDIDIIE
ncbi:MAG: histidine phosphatase family protein [Bacilli bacterium]